MKKIQVTSHTPQETMQWGERIAKRLWPSSIICLSGNLGSGKTTFVKGVARGLKISPMKVNSPTFVLLNIYEGKRSLFHFDFYRLEQLSEIEKIGYDEFLYGEGVAVIEWAERLQHLFPMENLTVNLSYKSEKERTLEIVAHGERYERLLEEIGRKGSLKF